MKKTLINTGIVVLTASIALYLFVRLTSKNSNEGIIAEAKQGYFEVTVNGIGELMAEKSYDIRGPNVSTNNHFRSGIIEIKDIVPEGTIVKKGDYIATLDRSAFANTLKDEETELKEDQDELENKLLDTSVVLSALRDDINNQGYETETAKLAVDVSLYEPPATRRKADLEYGRQMRLLDYKKRLYFMKKEQAAAEAMNINRKVRRQQRIVDDYRNILDQFTVKAPDDGMVTYKRERNGTKRKAGSFINPWDPVVATLPDLSSLVSKIYVSEIEVRKVRTGQPVQVTIDAFPKNSFSGEVSGIANIGEILPNSDSKVFEVLVRLNQDDPLLRPSMTTSNRIITSSYDDVIYVPIESLHAEADNIPFVYTKKGIKQVVVPGEANDKYIIIEQGLKPGTEVYIVQPGNADKFRMAGLDLIHNHQPRQLAANPDYSSFHQNIIVESH